MTDRVHNPRADMASADSPEVRAWWERVFDVWFPGYPLQWNGLNRSQLRGTDVSVITPGAVTVHIDVKTRSAWWGDLLLEIEHVYDGGRVAPGWAIDPHWGPHYLATGCPRDDVAIRFDATALGRWARANEATLRQGADERGLWVEARNAPGYVTRSITIDLRHRLVQSWAVELYPLNLTLDRARARRLRSVI